MINKTYEQGFIDGMSCDQKYPQTFMFMGYSVDQLVEIVCKNEEKTEENREKFRKELAEAGFAGFTTFTSPILRAYDMVHYPKLRK